MPYSSVDEIPDAVKDKLKSKKKRRQWMHVWNSGYQRHGNESRAFAEAWATVNKAANTMSDDKKFSFFIPLSKVQRKDDGTCIVSGYASTPTMDCDGEVVSLDAVKKALPSYMQWRNIREMHRLSAVGKAQEASIDDVGLHLKAKIVDPAAVKKCIDGVYQGFSIGGRKLAKSGDTITEIEMTEISVVDRPANPDCRITIAKSAKEPLNGSAGHLMKAKDLVDPNAKAVADMAKVIGRLAKANNPPAARDGFSLPAPTKKASDDNPAKPDGVQSINDQRPQESVTRKADSLETKQSPQGNITDPPPQWKGKKAKKDKKKAKKLAKIEAGRRRQAAVRGLEALELPEVSTIELAKIEIPTGDFSFELTDENRFLELKPPKVKKRMGSAGSLAYCFDTIRDTQRALLTEAQREGGDKKDAQLAKQLGNIAKDLAAVIGQKAEHEGAEALDLSDADDSYVRQLLGEDLAMSEQIQDLAKVDGAGSDPLSTAVVNLLKRATTPTRTMRMKAAVDNLKKARKARKDALACVEKVHKAMKAAYLSKLAKAGKGDAKDKDKDSDDFDMTDAMSKLQKAYGEMQKVGTFMKAAREQLRKAASRSGERGQEMGDAVSGVYEVPPGIKPLGPSDLATAPPGGTARGSQPPLYPADGSTYPGKGATTADLIKAAGGNELLINALLEKAKTEGELEALRRTPSNGRRPFAFDMSKVTGNGNGNDRDKTSALFKGVDPAALASQDEMTHNQATARVIGNLLTSGHFGQSVFDTNFHGGVVGRD